MANLRQFTFTNLADTAISNSDGWQINSGELINALEGDDTISGASRLDGISNILGSLNTSGGNDIVTGTSTSGYGFFNYGTVSTGDGNDTVKGISSGANGLYNYTKESSIFTGSGDDTILGSTTARNSNGIDNFGSIKTESGNDIIDALTGGFNGTGTVDLGSGNDTLKGFGSGTFKGGTGSDTLVLNPGTYKISVASRGNYLLTSIPTGSSAGMSGSMIVSGFELFGPGANVSSFRTAASAGSVTFS